MINDIPYIWVPITAVISYAFLAITLLSAQKNKQIASFIVLLISFMLWSGGSMLMRLGVFPSYRFWYNVSIEALFLVPFLAYNFLFHFVNSKEHFHRIIWLGATVAMIILTRFEIFLQVPTLITLADGKSVFSYNMTWKVLIPTVIIVSILGSGVRMCMRSIKNQDISISSITPIMVGLSCLIVGNFLSIVPGNFFPWDTLMGIVNALLMFYALYKKRLFKMTLLVRKGVVVMESIILIAPITARLIQPVEVVIEKYLPIASEYVTLIFAVFFTGLILTVYQVLSVVLGNLFLKEEQVQNQRLRNLSQVVSRSLDLKEILELLIEAITSTINVSRVYVCLYEDSSVKYKAVCAATQLDKKSFFIFADNPCVEWMKKYNRCMILKEFERSSMYKSMWESEKKLLKSMRISCMLPIKCDDDLTGIVLLSEKAKSGEYNFDDVTFLESAQSIISVAVKNAKLYQQASFEARTDHLTGLLNRKTFLEILDEEYENCKKTSLALIIFNIDDFKLFNQLYGAHEGDIALQKIARIISNTAGANGTVGRYGGKEFAVCMPNYDMRQALVFAQNIKQQMKNVNDGTGKVLLKPLTFSCGICVMPYSATTIRELVENTDMAVYNAKRSGKNKILTYTMEAESGSQDGDEKKLITNYEEYAPTIYALTAAIDAKDHYTFNHSQNVATYASTLAREAGLNEEHVKVIYEAALLHDIGKIAIPEVILRKPGGLTDEEYEVMKTHVEHSIAIVRHLPSLDYVVPAAIGHHERWDGRGYPRGIAGEDIPIGARCLAIADSFDAMTSQRSYKAANTVEYAVGEIKRCSGKQFDPYLAAIFVKLVESGAVKVPERQEI